MAKTRTEEPQKDISSSLVGLDNKFGQGLTSLWKAGYQCALVNTRENKRVEQIAMAFAEDMTRQHPDQDPCTVVQWDPVNGFIFMHNEAQRREKKSTCTIMKPSEQAALLRMQHMNVQDPLQALQLIPKLDNAAEFVTNQTLVIMHEMYPFFRNSPHIRTLLKRMHAEQDMVGQAHSRFVLFVQSTSEWHPEVEHCIRRLSLPLPNDEEMEYALAQMEKISISTERRRTSPNLIISGKTRRQAIEIVRGLSFREAEDVFALSYIERDRADDSEKDEVTLRVLEEYKASAVSNNTGLTYVPKSKIANIGNIRGFDAFLAAVEQRAQAYNDDAKRAKLDAPRGYVLVGVPGTGKSQIGKSLAKVLNKALWIWDPSMCMGSLVGQSETQVEDALQKIEAQRGCVLLLDEFDKLFGNATKNSGDGGVSARIFGRILRWLQEHNDGSVVILTLNSTENVSPELFRSGRFDGTFGVGRPNEEVRKQILQVHFALRGVTEEHLELVMDNEAWAEFGTKSEGLLGSDIEEVVKESRSQAYIRLRDRGDEIKDIILPTKTEILEAVDVVQSQSITKLEPEKIRICEEFVKSKCRPVYEVPSANKNPKQRTRGTPGARNITLTESD